MRETTVKKQWITDDGYIAVVLYISGSHHNGYVGVPDKHPIAHDSCPTCGNDLETRYSLEVHGGVTYQSHSRVTDGAYPVPANNIYWLGFDCAHSCDLTEHQINEGFKFTDNATFKDVDYVVRQCEKLSKQLADMLKK